MFEPFQKDRKEKKDRKENWGKNFDDNLMRADEGNWHSHEVMVSDSLYFFLRNSCASWAK